MNAATTSSTAASGNPESLDGTERAPSVQRSISTVIREIPEAGARGLPKPGQVLCWAHAILELGGTFGLFLGACQTRPPANWAQGGSPLDIPRARWTRGSRIIDIMPDGKVLADGEHCSRSTAPVAFTNRTTIPSRSYKPDGQLVGAGDTSMGKIGLRNASLPGKEVAWLSWASREVQRFDPDGEPHADGIVDRLRPRGSRVHAHHPYHHARRNQAPWR